MRNWLKKLRMDNGMTQREVADKLGIVQHYYSMIETGERQRDIDFSLIIKLSELFNVSIEWIAGQENENKAR